MYMFLMPVPARIHRALAIFCSTAMVISIFALVILFQRWAYLPPTMRFTCSLLCLLAFGWFLYCRLRLAGHATRIQASGLSQPAINPPAPYLAHVLSRRGLPPTPPPPAQRIQRRCHRPSLPSRRGASQRSASPTRACSSIDTAPQRRSSSTNTARNTWWKHAEPTALCIDSAALPGGTSARDHTGWSGILPSSGSHPGPPSARSPAGPREISLRSPPSKARTTHTRRPQPCGSRRTYPPCPPAHGHIACSRCGRVPI